MTQNVFVGVWTHKYGEDVSAFKTLQGVLNWKKEIAESWFADSFPDEPIPPPEEIGDTYFKFMAEEGDEYFQYTEMELKP